MGVDYKVKIIMQAMADAKSDARHDGRIASDREIAERVLSDLRVVRPDLGPFHGGGV